MFGLRGGKSLRYLNRAHQQQQSRVRLARLSRIGSSIGSSTGMAGKRNISPHRLRLER
ncbi:hypothetical protein LPJ53_003830 [Coemansia erecta]|uniref:Uncharacterized protein n=1 Tax=Coemansia erecta TaxID=147472 RepID=A0A9W7XZ39_9FUNG|nr:hypothetical protein LPJ53_003830 [Coemansia erecta]